MSVQPKPIERSYDIEKYEDYLKIASAMEFFPEELENYLLYKAHIPIFDLQEVYAFLEHKCEVLNKEENERTGRAIVRGYWYRWSFAFGHDHLQWLDEMGRQKYNKIIPSRVMKLAAAVKKIFPDVGFYVSEIEKMKDPFIMAVTKDKHRFVFAVWDEPGFTGGPEV